MQNHRQVVRGTGQVLDRLQQGDGLDQFERQVVALQPGLHVVDLLGDLRGQQVAGFQQFVHEIERHQSADGGIGQAGAVVDHHLLRLLDDRAVAAADVAVGAALEPEAGDDVDAEVNLIRQIGIEPGE